MELQISDLPYATISNEEFEALDPAGKRVAIAKDVLNHLSTGKFFAFSGSFVDGYALAESMETEVRDAWKEMYANRNCSVCALGGMMLSTVDRCDKLKVKDLRGHQYERYPDKKIQFEVSGDDVSAYLSRFFDEDQLFLIEAAFEKNCGYFKRRLGEYKVKLGPLEFMEETERMEFIMRNIIDNNGTFVIETVRRFDHIDD